MTEYLFDPGYGQHLLSLIFSLEDMYEEINKYKNLGQKKFQFRQYFPSILKLLEQNTDFYLGCLLWAVYLKNQPEGNITGNYCYGKEYNEETSLIELLFLIKFTQTFSKDTRYYMGQDFSYPEEYSNMLGVYKEFAIMNKGFTNVQKNTDLKLPEALKTPSKDELETIKSTIGTVVKTGNFDLLEDIKGLIL